MKKNLLKEKINRKKVAFGAQIMESSTGVVEILGLLGFDYLTIDCLHSPMSFETVAQLIMAAEIRGLTPLVRIPQNSPEIILRYLDAGAMGVIVADMDSPEVAQAAVRAAKYSPMGERGLSPVRAADFGLKEPLGKYVKAANLETMVLGIVESREGVECIEEILATEGLDGVSIGTTDLSKSLGVPGQRNHPLVLEAIEIILAAGRKTGKHIGSTVRQGESSMHYIEKGFRMVYATLTSLLADAANRFLDNTGG